LDLKL